MNHHLGAQFSAVARLFYSLANGWLERALAALKEEGVVERIVARLKRDLHYKSVKAWPIFERENGGAIMYYMIHATDHPEAPKFMSRAYRRAVLPLEPIEQLTLDLFSEGDDLAEQPTETLVADF
jgi:hypothetical protein